MYTKGPVKSDQQLLVRFYPRSCSKSFKHDSANIDTCIIQIKTLDDARISTDTNCDLYMYEEQYNSHGYGYSPIPRPAREARPWDGTIFLLPRTGRVNLGKWTTYKLGEKKILKKCMPKILVFCRAMGHASWPPPFASPFTPNFRHFADQGTVPLAKLSLHAWI